MLLATEKKSAEGSKTKASSIKIFFKKWQHKNICLKLKNVS